MTLREPSIWKGGKIQVKSEFTLTLYGGEVNHPFIPRLSWPGTIWTVYHSNHHPICMGEHYLISNTNIKREIRDALYNNRNPKNIYKIWSIVQWISVYLSLHRTEEGLVPRISLLVTPRGDRRPPSVSSVSKNSTRDLCKIVSRSIRCFLKGGIDSRPPFMGNELVLNRLMGRCILSGSPTRISLT